MTAVVAAAMAEGAAQKPSELERFVAFLRDRDLRTVLEIGTMSGGTLRAWCELADDDATIMSVDLPGGRWGGGYADGDINRLTGFAKPGQKLMLIRDDSHAEATREAVRRVLKGRPVDLLFIDGDHTYEGVAADFLDYEPMVANGGLIAFHDILPHPDVPDCDVDKFWSTLESWALKRWEFCDPSDRHPQWGQWGGIGVIEKP